MHKKILRKLTYDFHGMLTDKQSCHRGFYCEESCSWDTSQCSWTLVWGFPWPGCLPSLQCVFHWGHVTNIRIRQHKGFLSFCRMASPSCFPYDTVIWSFNSLAGVIWYIFFEPSVSWLYRYPLLCDFMKLLFLNSELQFFLTFIMHHVSVEYPLTSTGTVLSLKYVYNFYCVLQHHSRLSVLIQNFRCECCFNVTNGCL